MTARRRDLLALLALALAVAVVYLPPALLRGDQALFGLDFVQLHQHRLAFLRSALGAGHVPAWYPRELGGTPFWSNLHSAPLIPTRLLLLGVPPELGLTVGALVAAELAALFTFAFARRLGLDRLSAAAAGWTFACAGFFASRLLAGHLPLLEAYPALPLLLWLADRPPTAAALAALAAATAAVTLAGHPQLPVYAIVATALYAVVLRRGQAVTTLAALALGAATTLFAWWPMLRLAARSARTLGLDPPANDLALPVGRLVALVAPWRDGWPALVERRPLEQFTGYPTAAYFWDSVSYVGLAPLAAVVALLVWRGPLRAATRVNQQRAHFFFVLGAIALVTALPWRPTATLSWPTILRSPARQLYLTTFCLALALGAGLQALRRAERLGPVRQRTILALLVLTLHALDLGDHARAFLHLTPRQPPSAADALAIVQANLGDARVAVDLPLRLPWNRRFDDLGFFDSLPLAAPYAALLAASDLSPGLNVEALDGGALPAATLRASGVRFVVTGYDRPDLTLRATLPQAHLYELSAPAPRAQLVATTAARYGDRAAALAELRRQPDGGATRILLPPEAAALAPAPGSARDDAPADVRYTRPSSDDIRVTATSRDGGWLRVLETWDPGWQATLDGQRAPVVCADAHLLAVPLPPGAHTIALTFHTPGARTGLLLSLVAVALLLALLLAVRRGGWR